MIFLAESYGPFASVVGYVTAGIAAISAIAVTWRGSLLKWKPPEEDLPNAAQKAVTALAFIGMVGLWLHAAPELLPMLFWIAVACGVLLLICFLAYSGLIGKYTYIKEVVVGSKATKEVMLIGGWDLKPEAKQEMKKHNVKTIQEFLEGNAYDADALWSRESRRQVKTLLIGLFVVTLLSGTLAVTAAGFAVQVRLSDRPAAEVVEPTTPAARAAEVREGPWGRGVRPMRWSRKPRHRKCPHIPGPHTFVGS